MEDTIENKIGPCKNNSSKSQDNCNYDVSFKSIASLPSLCGKLVLREHTSKGTRYESSVKILIFSISFIICIIFNNNISFNFSSCKWRLTNGTLCAIYYHLYNLKNMKNTYGEVLLLVKFDTPPRVYFTFFNSANGTKFRKASQIQVLEFSFIPLLTHFMLLASSCTPGINQETCGFLIFSGVQKQTRDMKWVKQITILCSMLRIFYFNSFMTEAPIIQKPIHWFALQINGLIST